MIDYVLKFIKVLNSEREPVQLAMAFAFAMVAGLTPLFSAHNLLVLLLILVLRVNLSAFFIGLALFSPVGYLFDPLFHKLGIFLLKHADLQWLWVDWYNSAFWRMTRFNNSIVMGSVVVSLLLFFPVLFLADLLIRRYREQILARLRRLRVVEMIKASKWFRRYQSLRDLRNV